LLNLTPAQRRSLRARAHALHPVVFIGDKGLSQNVLDEIASSLDSHELIKVRAGEADRDARDALLAQICEQLEAAPVQHIGKILVIYRPAPEKPAATQKRRAPARKPRTKRSFQGH
jgi:RNA-binding protein